MCSAPDAGLDSALSPTDSGLLAGLGHRALDEAARAIANLAVALDPEIIAVSGGMLRSADQIIPRLVSALDQLVPFPPRLVLAHFAERAPLAGACLLAYRAAAMAEPGHLDLAGTATKEWHVEH